MKALRRRVDNELSKILALPFFFRNGVFPASASIDAHNRFIKEVQTFYKYRTPKG
jgi:hypothetical protein